MAATWTALWMNASNNAPQYDAAALRSAGSARYPGIGSSRPLGTRSGRRAGSWIVTLAGNTIQIGSGSGVLDVETPADTGPYEVASSGTDTSLTFNAADATRTRYDLVSVTVNDNAVDNTGQLTVVPQYTPGSASASPALPATPARSLAIAQITVPPAGQGSASVTMLGPLLGSAPIHALTAADRGSLSQSMGAMSYQEDTAVLYMTDRINWYPIASANAPTHYKTSISTLGASQTGTTNTHFSTYDFSFTPSRDGWCDFRVIVSASNLSLGSTSYPPPPSFGDVYMAPSLAVGGTATVLTNGVDVVLHDWQPRNQHIFNGGVVVTAGTTYTAQLWGNAGISTGSWQLTYVSWDFTLH